MQFVRVGLLILLLLAGWVSVRAEPGLVHMLESCAAGWGGGSSLTRAAQLDLSGRDQRGGAAGAAVAGSPP